ncbi:MAG: hypothetical protein ACETWQ_20455 [Phycisphaerae bacterium]
MSKGNGLLAKRNIGVVKEYQLVRIEPITATASSMKSAEENPTNTINGSGLDANDIHSTPTNGMWLSDVSAPGETWI